MAETGKVKYPEDTVTIQNEMRQEPLSPEIATELRPRVILKRNFRYGRRDFDFRRGPRREHLRSDL